MLRGEGRCVPRPGAQKGDTMMAYLQFDTPQAGPAPAIAFTPAIPLARVEVVEPQADFSHLEWSVVALASAEPMSSLRGPGLIAALLSSLFGIRTSSGLADPKLEALRRMAVIAWHNGYKVPTHELNSFIEAGYSVAHYEALQTRIGRERQERNGRRFN
jgi:hypothetical protein